MNHFKSDTFFSFAKFFLSIQLLCKLFLFLCVVQLFYEIPLLMYARFKNFFFDKLMSNVTTRLK